MTAGMNVTRTVTWLATNWLLVADEIRSPNQDD
jgi:hypothetical protein